MEAQVRQEFDHLKEKATSIEEKVDRIMEVVSQTNTKVEVISTNQKNHDKQDDEKFAKIDRKFDLYDKLIIGFLGAAILNLIGVIIAIVR